jgi:hypothetical protein
LEICGIIFLHVRLPDLLFHGFQRIGCTNIDESNFFVSFKVGI